LLAGVAAEQITERAQEQVAIEHLLALHLAVEHLLNQH
jgi:hypothetical protein